MCLCTRLDYFEKILLGADTSYINGISISISMYLGSCSIYQVK